MGRSRRDTGMFETFKERKMSLHTTTQTVKKLPPEAVFFFTFPMTLPVFSVNWNMQFHSSFAIKGTGYREKWTSLDWYKEILLNKLQPAFIPRMLMILEQRWVEDDKSQSPSSSDKGAHNRWKYLYTPIKYALTGKVNYFRCILAKHWW